MAYQKVQYYQGNLYGSPQWTGIEYDREVSDNNVISSPGGVASTMGHYTKGFYGEGGTSSDFYAGQGQRYIAGEYGNLYQVGDMAAQQMGYYYPPPDARFPEKQPLRPNDVVLSNYNYLPMNYEHPDYSKGIDNYASGNSGVENFTPVGGYQGGSSNGDNIEFVPRPDVSVIPTEPQKPANIRVNVNPLVLIGILVVGYIAINFWTNASMGFLSQVFHGGKTPKWTELLLYAVLFTLLLVLVIAIFKVTVIQLEQY